MNNLDKQYQNLLRDILKNGVEKKDRTGTGTLSVFGRQIRHNMSEGFPLLTTKKMAIKSIMTELKWFLKGDTNIKYLLENNCHIWTGDVIKNYENHNGKIDCGTNLTKQEYILESILFDDEFAKKWGELGPIYGKQWRSWTSNEIERKKGFIEIDQIQNLINDLKTNPDSRRLVVSAWNVGELNQMVLPPCHYGFQLYTRKSTRDEKIVNPGKYRVVSLMWNQRSVDSFLGLPFNIASYGTLLQLIADECDMIAGELIGNLGDTHLYLNHIEQAQEQISREPFEYLPTLKLSNVNILNGEFNYDILNYKSHPILKAPLSN